MEKSDQVKTVLKGQRCLLLFAVQVNAVVDSKSQQNPNISTGKDPSHQNELHNVCYH